MEYLKFLFCILCFTASSIATFADSSSYKIAANELLSSDEVFIQFRDVTALDSYGLNSGRNPEYVAVIIDPLKDNVEMAYLFDSRDLAKYGQIVDVDNANLGTLIWNNLIDYIKSKKSIYFSLSGSLSSYPIEYLISPIERSLRMNEIYNMYRLSSFDQLALRNNNSFNDNRAVVFGGLEYDLNTQDDKNTESAVLAFRSGYGKLKELPEAKKEVLYIDSVLRRNKIPASLATGKDGTARLFKSIQHSTANLLHVATHGYYDPLNYSFKTDLENWMLDRTGICFAGDYNSTNASESIVTGSDISSLDLSKLDIAVISSCQSGLGDIFEGYQYGLAKAFKCSGSKAIMCSLWEVNDLATCFFMESFYKHWLKNKNITKSMCLAQNEIINRKDTIIHNYPQKLTSFQIRRNQKYRVSTNSSYNDTIVKTYTAPDYWASFVVYDAFPIKTNIISDKTKNFISSFLKENIIGSSQVMEDLQQWEVVKSSLSDDESIVLMYNYTLPSMDEEYVALIFSNKYNTGKIVPLFINKFNTKYSKEDIVSMEAVADSIWSKLNAELAYSKHIYFRPTGILNKIPFENILQFRLSNSLYRITAIESLINNRVQHQKEDRADTNICLIGAFKYHSGISYLPTSLSEIETIEICYNQYSRNHVSKISVSKKENLLSNMENANILHFSTHCSALKIGRMSNLLQLGNGAFRLLSIREHQSVSDLLLSSHIMPFASNDSDYIVSALDISKLDLSNVDFCMLAASNSLYSYSTSCQDFGLLKGLKLAGVKSIMGSLWNADDKSTQMLITQFYTNLTSGKSKRQSLLDAQRYLREYEETITLYQDLTPLQKKHREKRGISTDSTTETGIIRPYENPLYWAAFILLDAID